MARQCFVRYLRAGKSEATLEVRAETLYEAIAKARRRYANEREVAPVSYVVEIGAQAYFRTDRQFEEWLRRPDRQTDRARLVVLGILGVVTVRDVESKLVH